MIVDVHTHIGGYKEKLHSFIKAMDTNEIDVAVVHPIVPRYSNEEVAEAVASFPDRLIGFASIIPTIENAKEQLKYVVEKYNFKGLKLHPSLQGFCPVNPRVVSVVREAARLRLPVLFHTGPGGGRQMRYNDPLYIDDLATMVPEATIIIGHSGGPGGLLTWSPSIAQAHTNVYLDTTGLNSRIRFQQIFKGLLEDIIAFVGARKILYGSDANPANIERFWTNLEVVQNLEISANEKELILGGNAQRLLNQT